MTDPRCLFAIVLACASAAFSRAYPVAITSCGNPCSPCTPVATIGGNCGVDFVLVALDGGTSAVCLPDWANANCLPKTTPPCYGAFGVAIKLPAGGSVQVPGQPPPEGPCVDAPAGGGWVPLPVARTHPDGPPQLSGCGAVGDSGILSIFPNNCGAPNGAPICMATFVVSCTDCVGIVGPS